MEIGKDFPKAEYQTEGWSNKKCDCDVCNRTLVFNDYLSDVKTDKAKEFFNKLMDALLQTEEDLSYETAIEVPRLKATIERYEDQLDRANKALSKWPPAMGRNGRMNVGEFVEMLVGEIERKDNIIQDILLEAWDDSEIDVFEAVNITIKKLKEAQSSEEEL